MRRLAWFALAAAWAALLIYLGTRPGDDLPRSGLLAAPGVDKLLHAGLYAVLGFLTAAGAGRRGVLFGALAGLLWGVLDESLQTMVPGRTASYGDVAADVVGALIGGLARQRTARAKLR